MKVWNCLLIFILRTWYISKKTDADFIENKYRCAAFKFYSQIAESLTYLLFSLFLYYFFLNLDIPPELNCSYIERICSRNKWAVHFFIFAFVAVMGTVTRLFLLLPRWCGGLVNKRSVGFCILRFNLEPNSSVIWKSEIVR